MSTHESFIVVGVDHSRAAVDALAFALDEGVAHGCAVEVVTAWLWSSPYEGMDEVGTIEEGNQAAAAVQDSALGEALAGRPDGPVVSQTVVHQDAGQALVERSEGARMLVVGSARKGAVSRAVLGSVSEYCVRHAPAPVFVLADAERVRHRTTREIQTAPDLAPPVPT
jgi:nucleotide-binding universal stress UspA family protein